MVTDVQGAAEKFGKTVESQLNDANNKLDEYNRNIQELTSMKGRMDSENSDLNRQLEDIESQLTQMTRAKQTMQKQLEEARGNLEDESRMRAKLHGENRNLQADCDQLREQLEEEQEGRSDMQRMLTKATNEINEWRRKFESGEGGVRSEELDDLKRKMNAKLAEAESALEAAQAKVAQLEKVKHRLNGEMGRPDDRSRTSMYSQWSYDDVYSRVSVYSCRSHD